ncbi:MAG: hypothetical protein AAF556_11075, partial [Pseudomonadota bacterium]
ETEDMANRHMETAAWHEIGHAVAYARGHDSAFTPLPVVGLISTPAEKTAQAEQMASRNGDEQYAEGYSFRQMGSTDPDRALVTALEMTDLRAVNVMAAFFRQIPLAPIYSLDNASTAAIRDIGTYTLPGAKVADPGSDASGADTPSPDTVAEQTYQAVLDGRVAPKALAELAAKGSALPDALKTKSKLGFAQQLGEIGRTADHAATYYFARNYAAAMDRLLPGQHEMRIPFAQAADAIAKHPKAAEWDLQNPPAQVAIIAATRQLRATGRQPEPAKPRPLGR